MWSRQEGRKGKSGSQSSYSTRFCSGLALNDLICPQCHAANTPGSDWLFKVQEYMRGPWVGTRALGKWEK